MSHEVSSIAVLARLILVLPLAGFVLNGLVGERWGRRAVGVIGSGVVGLAFLCALMLFAQLLRLEEGQRQVISDVFSWIGVGELNVSARLLVDPLSAVMVLVVSGVSFLIHVYSIGYMGREANFSRFFAYLNLFVFSMLLLVLAGNFLLMFVGWEGVGLCSYLLIGFWFERESAARAGNKAFIVNRIGDLGFLLGVILIFATFGSLDFDKVFGAAPEVLKTSSSLANLIALLLFVGAIGKSAQVPLYIWLPDAMEGPTPVSALIHAATMVTAGVYMVARCHVLYLLAPPVLIGVAAVGALTAIYAASIGLVQNDIKRVLAYSTISQLGYMFLGCGVAAFSASIFHLMTHAFFKALLFLTAGSVIHALANEQDMRKMGGLYPYMRVTGVTFWVAALAISAIPPLSGFFSKDEILWGAFSDSSLGPSLWVVGAFTGAMTSFYVARLGIKTFHGKPRWTAHANRPVHESPPVMTVPMAVLGLLAAVGGLVGVPAALGGRDNFGRFLEPVFASPLMPHAAHPPGLETILMAVSAIVSLGGIVTAVYFYIWRPELPGIVRERFRRAYRLVLNNYYVDEGYAAGVVRPGERMADYLAQRVDAKGIDGAVNGIAALVNSLSLALRRWQTGLVRNYAFLILIAIIALLFYSIRR